MSQLGHNKGPTLESGYTWRKLSWSKARADLLPNLPIEVLRTRVKRAKALGLPYKTYASVRAASGHDVVAFLFSNNALRMLRDGHPMPHDRATAVTRSAAEKLALVHPPMSPARLQGVLASQGITLAAPAACAPHFAQSWSDIADAVCAPVRQAWLPKDGILVIAETGHERDWCAAGKFAGIMQADRFFAGNQTA